MAQIYPERPGVPAGATLTLHASSNLRFRVDFYRQGATLQFKQNSDWMDGWVFNAGPHDTDWGWQGYDFAIPSDWESGVYIALAVEEGSAQNAADPNNPQNEAAKALFVVTAAEPGQASCILYKVPIFTYHAYNQLGNPPGSLYTGSAPIKVTMRRPGGGAGGDPWDHVYYPDVYEPGSARQTFAHWDAPFIQWLEGNGYAVEYTTDLDVHENPNEFLSAYRLLLSVGHDEYWSAEMRQHVEGFVSGCGNVAFFAGNVSWWRVHLTDNNTAFTCDKSPHINVEGPFDLWWNGQARLPENSLTGVSYRNAGGHWLGARPAVGYTVQYADHWVYEGVRRNDGSPIQEGDIFGDGNSEALVGYECDGAAIAGKPDPQGHVVAALTDGTPASFLILGVGKLPGNWQDPQAADASAATMGLYSGGGIVFTAATTDWSRLLVNPTVDRITRNVLNRLRSRGVRILGISYNCGRDVAVEGATIKFHADTSLLPQQGNLTFQWTASAGTPDVENQPVFRLTLPSPPVAVTITVTINDGTDCPAFGTFTFMPLTNAEYEQFRLICRLREVLAQAQSFRQPLEGIREGNRFFIDPLWDPIRGSLLAQISQRELHQLVGTAQDVISLATRLVEPAH